MCSNTATLQPLTDLPPGILDTMPDAIVLLDRDWRFVYLNRAAQRLAGSPLRRLAGRIIWEQFPQAVGTSFEINCRKAMTQQIEVQFEDRDARRDAWYFVRTFPCPQGLCIHARDVTETKLAQESLWRSEQKLRLAEQVADAGVWDIYLPTGYSVWSEGLYRLFGLDPSVPASYPAFLSLVHEDDRERYARIMRQSVENHTDSRIEFRINHPTLGQRWLLSIGRTFYDAEQRPIRRSGVKLDITEQKRDEQRLRESERHYRRLIETANEGIWILDAKACTTFTNAKLEAILGYAPGEMIGKHVLEFVSDARRPAVEVNLQRRRRGIAEQFDMCYQRKDGTEVWTHLSTNPIFDQNDRYTGVLGMITDITARKNAEEQMRRAKDAAESANRAKDDFLTTVSHELRTPIGAVLIWAKLLQAGLQNDPAHRQAIDAIIQCATDQMRLTDELLDASRIAHSQDRINLRPVDLQAVVNTAADTVRAHAQVKGIEVKLCLTTASVLGDAIYLQQMVSHLISNAIKFTSGTGLVEVLLKREQDQATLIVRDHGDGIDPAFLPHVFEQFRQADESITRKQGGLGLGLYTVRNIVELHGGTISAHSHGIGQGTEFTVKLPLLPASSHSHRKPRMTIPSAPTEPTSALSNVRFLVLHQTAKTRDELAMMLESCDASGRTAESMAEAWTLLQKYKPQVLICDIPENSDDRRELIMRLRDLDTTQGKRTYVIAIPQQPDDNLKLAGVAVDAFVTKPLKPHALAEALHRAMAAEP